MMAGAPPHKVIDRIIDRYNKIHIFPPSFIEGVRRTAHPHVSVAALGEAALRQAWRLDQISARA